MRALAFVSVILFGISACASHTAAISDQPVVADTETTPAAGTEPPSSPDALLGAPISGQFTLESSGYTQTGILTLYPGVNGRDSALLQRGWESVGGVGADPCSNVRPDSNYFGTNFIVLPENAYYIFGTFEVTEDAKGFTPIDMRWQIEGDGDNLLTAVMGLGFSDGGKCLGITGGGAMFTPAMNGGTSWGPVAVEVVLAGYYSPEYPVGHRDLLQQYELFQRISGGFKVKKMNLPGPSKSNSLES